MQAASAFSSAGIDRGQQRVPPMLRRVLGNKSEFVLHDTLSSHRAELEDYVSRCFKRAYSAEVTEFAPLLLELRCVSNTSGVAGIRPASAQPLFLESYLDEPVETVARQFAGEPVERHEIAELCNLAALRPGACQLINIILAAALQGAGFRYACFAGTNQLERIVRKQHFAVEPVAVAAPARLGPAAAQWGSYYDSSPNVLLVDLHQTMQALYAQRLSTAVIRMYAETIGSLGHELAAFNFLAARPGAGAQ
jgi:hypothetical protein